MFALPLGPAARRRFLHTLTWDHSLVVTAMVLDLEDNVLSDVSDLLSGGQVDAAAEGRYHSTAAKVPLWDPAHALQFDTRSPVHGQLFVDRMIQITYNIRVWGGPGDWVSVPVFTGPVTGAQRDGPHLNVDCVGKELLLDKPIWTVVRYPKGSRITDAIRDLAIRGGEDPDKLDIPSWPDRFAGEQVLGRREIIWARATRFAQIANGRLAYSGDGSLHLRRNSDNVVFTFRDEASAMPDHGPTVMTEPKAQFDSQKLVNVVHVTGQPKAAGHPAPEAVAALPRDHPANSHRIGRRGSQWIMPEFLEDSDIRSGADAQLLADARLQALSREYTQVTFDSLPIPFLETGDMCAVHTAKTIVPTFRLSEFSLPLGYGGLMSVGTRRRVHDMYRRRWR